MNTSAQSANSREAIRRATETARAQGYALVVERAPYPAPYTHTAAARRLSPDNDHVHFLTHANSEDAAATLGLKILLSVLRGDDFWPEPAEYER
jgi:hypothetical protein